MPSGEGGNHPIFQRYVEADKLLHGCLPFVAGPGVNREPVFQPIGGQPPCLRIATATVITAPRLPYVLAPIAIMCVTGCAENPQVPQNGDEVARNAPSPTAQQTETCAPETEFERQGPVDYD